MALEAILAREKVHRVILEAYPEGIYVLVFEGPDCKFPYEDHLQTDWEMAKRACRQDYSITEDMWREIPDTRIMG